MTKCDCKCTCSDELSLCSCPSCKNRVTPECVRCGTVEAKKFSLSGLLLKVKSLFKRNDKH